MPHRLIFGKALWGLAIGEVGIMVGPTAGCVNIEHFQRLVPSDERVGCAGWQPQKIARLQAIFLAIEYGCTVTC